MSENAPLLDQTPDDPRERQPLWRRLRMLAYENVEGTIDSPFEFIILALILLNVILLIASTIVADPDPCFGAKCVRLGDKYDRFFETAEAVSVVVFTVEYILRIWACIEDPNVSSRISYVFSFFAMVDFLSIIPWWIALAFNAESPDFTTALRVFRLIRLLKADKYLQAFSLLGTVLAENATLLTASSFYAALIWIISSTALYLVEVDNPAMGTHFQSIPLAMFPTLLMLTGEVPLVDFTPIGQFFAGCIAVAAVAIFAVPSAILASSFIKAVQEGVGRELTVDC